MNRSIILLSSYLKPFKTHVVRALSDIKHSCWCLKYYFTYKDAIKMALSTFKPLALSFYYVKGAL